MAGVLDVASVVTVFALVENALAFPALTLSAVAVSSVLFSLFLVPVDFMLNFKVATLTEVFPCFFLSCTADARV